MLKNYLYTSLILLLCLFSFSGCVDPMDAVGLIGSAGEGSQGETVEEVDRYLERLQGKRSRLLEDVRSGARNPSGLETELVRLDKQVEAQKNLRKALVDESTGCFLPDALVQMGDGSFKPFVEVVSGDIVMSYDIGHDKQVSRTVVELYSVKSNHLYKINNEFETTGGERLLTQNGWKEINSLKKGDIIHVNGKMIKIFAIEFKRTNHTLYNMQVNNTHNFYVSAANGTKYLVHNCDGGDGK